MNLREKIVEYQDDSFDVTIKVRQADVRAGIRRSVIWQKTLDATKSETDPVVRMTLQITYPVLIASTESIVNKDPVKQQLSPEPTLEEFLTLPDALIVAWEAASYEVNPHWTPRFLEPKKEAAEGNQGEATPPGAEGKTS